MATRLYSTAPGDAVAGEGTNKVVEAIGSATTTKCIELTVDLGNVLQGSSKPLTRQDVLDALDRLKDYIIQGQWPPA